MLGDRRFVAFCAIALLPLYGFGQIYITLPVLLRDSVGVSPAQWGLLAALYAGCGVLFQFPVVRRTRGFDKLALLSLASACLGLGLAGAAFAPKGIATAACIMLVSAGSMLLVPIAPALVSQMAPTELRGRYMGAWTLVWMAGTALAPIFGGLAFDRLGRGAYLVILAVCLLGALLFALLRRAGLGAALSRSRQAAANVRTGARHQSTVQFLSFPKGVLGCGWRRQLRRRRGRRSRPFCFHQNSNTTR